MEKFHLEVLLKLLSLGFKSLEIPATITWQDSKLNKNLGYKRKSSTKIFKTIVSHLKFIVLARPLKYFAFFSGLSFLMSVVFIGIAFYNLMINSVAYISALTGLVLMIISMLFLGFFVIFSQLSQILVDSWSKSYQTKYLPSVKTCSSPNSEKV